MIRMSQQWDSSPLPQYMNQSKSALVWETIRKKVYGLSRKEESWVPMRNDVASVWVSAPPSGHMEMLPSRSVDIPIEVWSLAKRVCESGTRL